MTAQARTPCHALGDLRKPAREPKQGRLLRGDRLGLRKNRPQFC